jgi:hypothetical protein
MSCNVPGIGEVGLTWSVIPTPAEKQSGPMEIGAQGCHREGPTSSSNVEAANHQLIRESRFTLSHPARWASTTGPGARGPSPSKQRSSSSPRPRCADAAPGSSFEFVFGRRNFLCRSAYRVAVRRFETEAESTSRCGTGPRDGSSRGLVHFCGRCSVGVAALRLLRSQPWSR